MKKRKGYLLGPLVAAGLLLISGQTYGAPMDGWELSENGKRWQYLYSEDDPAQNEWITYEGKEYYVDSKGYMKTGWVTDANDGRRYYTGEDGAKKFNMFTPDDKYVGPEGVQLVRFDTYRKLTKKQLDSASKGKKSKTADAAGQLGFMLTDLNRDGYRDIIVVNDLENPTKVVMLAVWDPEEEKMVLSAEADITAEEMSRITFHPQTQAVWMVITDQNQNHISYLCLEDGGSRFENIWSFSVEEDDWGDPLYRINDDEATLEEWNRAVALADEEAGGVLEGVYLPLEKESIVQALNQAPKSEELYLWE